MNANAVVQYRTVGERAVRRYLQKLLDNPQNYREDALQYVLADIAFKHSIATDYSLGPMPACSTPPSLLSHTVSTYT